MLQERDKQLQCCPQEDRGATLDRTAHQSYQEGNRCGQRYEPRLCEMLSLHANYTLLPT